MTAFATGAAGVVVDIFDSIVVGAEGTLTNFASWALVFLGVSLVVGIITAILRKVG